MAAASGWGRGRTRRPGRGGGRPASPPGPGADAAGALDRSGHAERPGFPGMAVPWHRARAPPPDVTPW
ncbi:hypothetical protein GCM10027294_44060 [Marinactinospora endophytica]